MASGRPSGPCFLALGVYDQAPSPLYKENCERREMTVLRQPHCTPSQPPAHRPPNRLGKSGSGGCGSCLDFLHFDFTALSCLCPRHAAAQGPAALTNPICGLPPPAVSGIKPTEPAPCSPDPACMPLLLIECPAARISFYLNSAKAQPKAHVLLGPQGWALGDRPKSK